MAKYWCHGNHKFSDDACAELCTEEERRQCMIETESEKTKIKTSWLQPPS